MSDLKARLRDDLTTAIKARDEVRSSTLRMVLTAITGWGQEKDRLRAREPGFDHHLTKPVEVDSIRAILEATEPAI